MDESKSEAAKPLLNCSSCGRRTAGVELSPGCLSAKCARCRADPAAAAAATHKPAARKRSRTPATPVPAGEPKRRRRKKVAKRK